MKHFVVSLLILVIAFSMSKTAAQESSVPPGEADLIERIRRDLKDRVLIDEDVIVKPSDVSGTSLPAKFTYFTVEKTRIVFDEPAAIYIVANNKLFSSAAHNDFSSLLREIKVFDKNSLTAGQFVTLFSLMNYNDRELRIVNPPEHPSSIPLTPSDPNEVCRNCPSSKLPLLQKTAAGLRVTFWGRFDHLKRWEKSTVTVSKNYQVKHQTRYVPAFPKTPQSPRVKLLMEALEKLRSEKKSSLK